MVLNNDFRLSSDMKKYIRDSTNKYIEKYLLERERLGFNTNEDCLSNNTNSNNTISNNTNSNINKYSSFYLLPLVSLSVVSILSFFAGYHYKK